MASDLVIDSLGQEGAYDGGACTDEPLLKTVGCIFQGIGEAILLKPLLGEPQRVGGEMNSTRWGFGMAIGLFVVAFIVLTVLYFTGTELPSWIPLFGHKISPFRNKALTWGVGSRAAWAGEPSQATNFTNDKGARAAEYINSALSDGFNNHRENPYFPDVTNRVLRMENREKEAIRALGKINQERLRRAAEDDSSTTPLSWGPFWKEWRQTHPLDGEDMVSGFEGDSFQQKLNNAMVY